MGVDAKMLLRVPYEPSADQIKRWSWDICAALGARHFFVKPDEGLGAIMLAGARWREPGDPMPGRVYEQDGEPITAGAGEALLEVHLWTRYYGPGYERGDILTICAVAEWCERHIDRAAVWYGGDSSGICAKPFGKKERVAMLDHFFSPKGREYFNYRSFMLPRSGDLTALPEPCKLCVRKDGDFVRSGWGDHFAVMNCHGCGRAFETRDGGTTWKVREEKP